MCNPPLGIPLASQPRRFCSLGCSVSSAPGARTKVPLSYPAVSLWKAANGARRRVKISPKSTLCSECSFHPRRRSVLRYSTTPLLITSACHGNFVRQKRNALFWRDCNPWARPKAHLELNAVVVRYEQKGGLPRNTNKWLLSQWHKNFQDTYSFIVIITFCPPNILSIRIFFSSSMLRYCFVRMRRCVYLCQIPVRHFLYLVETFQWSVRLIEG